MKTIYFDCFAGASGNMIVGALLAAGVDSGELEMRLNELAIPGFSLEIARVNRSGISAVHLTVDVPDEKKHRHFRDIETIIVNSNLSELVKQRAINIFRRLAEAEAKVHGIDVENVHFHEVGAMDAIIDVVGACIGFEMLEIERFMCSRVHVGSGRIQIAHGHYPVPPPAVAELLKGIPVCSGNVEGELVTPTGAAIISTLCDSYGTLPEMIIDQIGYGAGTREYDEFPNVLRIMLGETTLAGKAKGENRIEVSNDFEIEEIVVLETNIDDAAPQILGFVMDRALKMGALDCWFTPIQMKKNRPATLLSVLCTLEQSKGLTEMIFSETTTLGVRHNYTSRTSLSREFVEVNTRYGRIPVKVGRFNGKIVNAMPEYEAVKLAALKNGAAFRIVREAVLAEFDELALSAGMDSPM